MNKPSAIQSESKKLGEEIQALLNHKSAREKTIIENLKSNKPAQVGLTVNRVRLIVKLFSPLLSHMSIFKFSGFGFGLGLASGGKVGQFYF